jgi:hypothetical protein
MFSMKDQDKLSRATFVRAAVILPALAGVFGIAAQAQSPHGTKAQFKYQNTPNGSQQCSNCTFFNAGKTATANGTCKIVQGDISPKGYCIAWSAKSS